MGLALAAAAAGPAAAATGGAGFGAKGKTPGAKHHARARRADVGGHVYPGDSVHMGDRILRQGMTGHDVRVLQDYLSIAGFGTPITGYFGSQTENNLLAFENSQNLQPTGVLTWKVSQTLRAAVAAQQTAEASGGTSTTTTTAVGPPGKATLNAQGLAVAPSNAPPVVQEIIAAANKIAFKPYVYGGGHGSWKSSGYDCSGSVSFALHGGGLLNTTEDSSQLESYGSAGAGQWITIWANAGHTFMEIAGLRFDTAAQGSTGGDRWTTKPASTSGYVERHPTGY